MSELYWISIISKLYVIFRLLFIISIILSIVQIIAIIACGDEAPVNAGKHAKLSIITAVIFGLGTVLIPSKDEAYLIYGVGPIVDYCKGNQKVKEIPDKAIDAFNIYLDSITEDKKNNIK